MNESRRSEKESRFLAVQSKAKGRPPIVTCNLYPFRFTCYFSLLSLPGCCCGGFMDANSVSMSVRLQDATAELHEVEAQLASADLDAGILADFRDSVNRVR